MSEFVTVRLADARQAPGFRPARRAAPEPVPAQEPQAPIDLFEEGYRQGRSDADQEFAAERARYCGLIAACEELQPEPSEALALLIAEAVESLVRLTVGEVSIDGATLLARARRAASLVGEVDGARLLHLHPEDLALIDVEALPVPAVADPALAPGSVRVEHASGWIEDGVAVHLDALREQLGLKEQAE